MKLTLQEKNILVRALKAFCDSEGEFISHRSELTGELVQDKATIEDGEKDIKAAEKLMAKFEGST